MNVKEKKILIMGEMLELGENSYNYHLEVLEKAKDVFDEIYFYDPNKKYNFEKLDFINILNKTDEIIKVLNSQYSYIYVKGSNGTNLWKIVEDTIKGG